MKKLTFFDILKDILLKQNGELHQTQGFDQVFSPFMVVRYLSMKPNLLRYANQINQFNKTNCFTPEQIYLWCYNNIPKQTNGYIKYIKKKKKV